MPGRPGSSTPQPLYTGPFEKSLPKPSFRIIHDDHLLHLGSSAAAAALAPGMLMLDGQRAVFAEQMEGFGFVGKRDAEFERPEHYLRWLEPTERELMKQVEYDLDEQDDAWLTMHNIERKAEGLDVMSQEVFEIILDRLEKEWFELQKRIPRPSHPMAITDSGDNDEEQRCAICDDGECENSNAIVFCDGCNVAVHQDCYGIPYIPEGQWLCRKCMISPEAPVRCTLCPGEGGAFKQTTDIRWAHLLCAIWIPEATLGNQIYMEPVDLSGIPKSRWKLICSLCKRKGGACIQCDNRSCFAAFHVTCARGAGLFIKMRPKRKEVAPLNGLDGVPHPPEMHVDDEEKHVLRAYCERHLPKDFLRKDDDSESDSPPPEKRKKPKTAQAVIANAKSAKAYSNVYKAGPPIVPQAVVRAIVDYLKRLPLRNKPSTVEAACRYWSLKREARRGAPLLKRLHLEPWTANNSAYRQSHSDKVKKYGILRKIRNDLERVRMLAELTRKREREKYRQCKIIVDSIDLAIFPKETLTRPVFEQVRAADRFGYFQEPVSRRSAPDYYDVIKRPMDFSTMESALRDHRYTIGAAAEEPSDEISPSKDLLAIVENAMVYNKPDTNVYRTATRLKKLMIPLIDATNEAYEARRLIHPASLLENKGVEELFALDYPMAAPAPPGAKIKPKKEAKARVRGIDPAMVNPDLLTEGRRTRSAQSPLRAGKKTPVQKNKPAKVYSTPTRSSSRQAGPAMLGTEGTGATSAERPGVSERESFDKFHHGWILPSTQKRRRTGSASPAVEASRRDEQGENGPAATPKKSAAVASVEEVERLLPSTQGETEVTPSIKAGSLVWAKVHSYPFYPAEIIDPARTEGGIPASVLSSRPTTHAAAADVDDGPLLVRFFESSTARSWAWIPRTTNRIRLCHVDRPLDELMLNLATQEEAKASTDAVPASVPVPAPTSVERRKKNKTTFIGRDGIGQGVLTPHMRTSVRLAYLKALGGGGGSEVGGIDERQGVE